MPRASTTGLGVRGVGLPTRVKFLAMLKLPTQWYLTAIVSPGEAALITAWRLGRLGVP